MAKRIDVTVDDWVADAVEKLKEEKNTSRSEVVNELLVRALLQFKSADKI